MAAIINSNAFLYSVTLTTTAVAAMRSSAAHHNNGHNFRNYTVVDSASPDILHLIDPHWYNYPPLHPFWFTALGTVIFIASVTSIIGNGVVIFVFTSTKSLRTPSNLHVVNLAISDFLLMFTMAPPLIINCLNKTWVFGPLMCEIYGLLGSQFGCVSIWSMTMIAYDRYNVIVKGLSGKPLTNNGALTQIAYVWLFSGIWTIAPMLGWNRYVPEGNMTACGTDYLTQTWLSRSYIIAYAIFVYYLPLFSICYSYYFILKAVAEHERSMCEQAKKMNVTSLRSSVDAKKSAEGKLAKVALMTITLWFIAWTPYLIINFAGIFGASYLPPLGTIWGSVFAKCNAVYNPIVYGISHPKYRAALIQKFSICNRRKVKDAINADQIPTIEELSTTSGIADENG